METNTTLKPAKTLIAFASHWGSKFGGINSFNTDLLVALGITFYRDIRVVCIVLDADAADIAKVAKDHVEVLSLNRPRDRAFNAELLEYVKNALSKAECTPNSQTVWLGHDRITGAVAVMAAKEMSGRSALIHHMSYAHYESYAAGAKLAAEKEATQRQLFLQGNVVLAVGPVLRDALEDMVEQKVAMLIPGLPEIVASEAPKTFTGFLSGRISPDTQKIKQAQLAIAGFANATARSNAEPALPDSLKASNNPCLKIRGLDTENESLSPDFDPETELKRFAEEYAKAVINLRALPFTTDRDAIFNELKRASVALMPSWHEGFGLVAWEAIAAGVPIILSKNSGVYHLLREIDNGIYLNWVYAVDVRGRVDEPFFHPEDLRKVSDVVIEIAKDPKVARSRAAQLRETLLNKDYTWKSCAGQLVEALGWPLLATPKELPPILIAQKFTASDSQPADSVSPPDDTLEIPVREWTLGRGLANSQLLRAEEAIVPFSKDALPFLDNQILWAQDQEFPIAVRLIVGSGGAGKTRLALQLCEHLRGIGWWAGLLRQGKRFPKQFEAIAARLSGKSQPSLIVIDYAETRRDDLVALLKPIVSKQSLSSVRVLLLARSGGEWWDRLAGFDSQCESLFSGRATSGPFTVPLLYDTPISKEIAFQEALTIFSTLLNRPKPNHSPDLSAAYFGHPLLVQMAALLALHDEQTKTAEGLTRSLVNHERRYWGRLLAETSATEEHAAQLMALSTLSDGLKTASEVESIWKVSDCGSRSELKVTFDHLRNLYPHNGGLQSLRPDLLGESLVTQVLLSSDGGNIFNALLKTSEARVRHHAWTVLARILRHREDMIPLVQTSLAAHYVKNAKDAVEVCCQTPSPLPKLMERAYDELPESLQLQVSQQLDDLFIKDQLPLNDLALRISETCLRQARRKFSRVSKKTSPEDLAALSSALTNTSVSLKRCGDWNRALQLATEAEGNLRHLAKDEPERYEYEWARSLNSYANRLSEVGHSEEALAKAKQSLEIYERLAKNKPEQFEGGWALSLYNYANRLGENGHSEEALSKAKQSMEIHERLAKGDPEEFEDGWAMSLNTYAHLLNENGNYGEAQIVAKQALDIYERLAKEKPHRFEKEWGASLDSFANCLSENGQVEQARILSKQAVDIFERLASAKPERFEMAWAGCLANYSIRLIDYELSEDALPILNQANEIYERWGEKLPAAYGAKHRSGLLLQSFLTWLCHRVISPKLPTERLDLPSIEHSKREWGGVIFFENCVRACLAMGTSGQLEHIDNAIAKWSELDSAMKENYQLFFFIIAAWVQEKSLTTRATSLPDWHLRYTAMAKRRRGCIPKWMQITAQILEFKLPVC